MKAYFLSGLGADYRAFQLLKLPPNIEVVHLAWLTPAKHESLHSYAKRMAEKINTDEPYYLVGLSFGGMLATEMLAFLKPQKTFFISSVLLRKELPFYFKFWFTSIGAQLMPRALITKPNWLIHFIFGVTSNQEKQFLDTIVKEANPEFVFWAIQQVLNFKQNQLPNAPYIRIHGTNDKILPIHHFIPTYTIANGSHFMVANRAKEISAILAKEMR